MTRNEAMKTAVDQKHWSGQKNFHNVLGDDYFKELEDLENSEIEWGFDVLYGDRSAKR